MEEVIGGELFGSIPGAIIGEVKLIPGMRGQALYVNGIDQRVDLGNQRHNCMGDLSKCNNGFVMAMWLRMHKYDEPGPYNHEYYISNGGQTINSIGIALLMREKTLLALFRTETRLWEIHYGNFYLQKWYHVVLAWSLTTGGKVYINGALVSYNQEGKAGNNNRQGNTYVNFMLGDSNKDPPKFPGEMTLDELRIWDAVPDEQLVWALYAGDAWP